MAIFTQTGYRPDPNVKVGTIQVSTYQGQRCSAEYGSSSQSWEAGTHDSIRDGAGSQTVWGWHITLDGGAAADAAEAARLSSLRAASVQALVDALTGKGFNSLVGVRTDGFLYWESNMRRGNAAPGTITDPDAIAAGVNHANPKVRAWFGGAA